MDIQSVNKKVWKSYPLFKGAEPRVRGSVLTYEVEERTPDGFPLKLRLRVEVDSEGHILQVSESK